jgi:hypothetical protein
MILYSWVAVSGSDRTPPGQTGRTETGRTESERTALGASGPWPAGPPVAMGITDDRGRAMRAGEETLWSGRAAMVIIEVVRPGMAAHTLAPCYVRTGVGWLGRRTPAGEVAWDRFFI